MTWLNRLKLLLGVIAVLAVVAGGSVVFDQRQHAATSTSGTIAAQAYPVGSDYAGTVTATYVRTGQHVVAGQKLVAVQSAALLSDLRRKIVTRAAIGYSVSKSGVITFTAAVDGTVASVRALTGAFVQAGATLLTVDKADSLFITARYVLSPTDYSRLGRGEVVDLTLPSQAVIEGRVSTISVITTPTGQAQAQLRIDSAKLVEGGDNGIVSPGTPITARVHLRDDGLFAGVTDQAGAFLRKIGL